jgi:hypothetical protein
LERTDQHTFLILLKICNKFEPGGSKVNRVLRKISGPKRGKVTGKWRKLHNEEIHKLCSSPNIISRSRHG